MRKLLALHGWQATSQSNWLPWLKKAGIEKGMEVIIPDLPEPDAPVLSDWLHTAKQAIGELQPGDIVIGHSMGGKAAMHFLQEYSVSGITCILVGPTYETIEDELDLGDPIDVKQKLRDFHETPLDFEKLNNLNNEYIVFISDNDQFINIDSVQKYYHQLSSVKFILFHGAGHFRTQDGYRELTPIFEHTVKTTIVDDNNEIIGYKRRCDITSDDTYRVSALWIENSVGDVLMAQRGFLKSNTPGKWGPAVAGTIDEGESYEDNIYKEAEEEIGLTGQVFETGKLIRSTSKWDHFTQWFTLVLDRDISEFTKEHGQVESLRWITPKELQNLIEKSPDIFTGNFNTYIKKRLN